MKGVAILKDEKNNKRILQVDVKQLAKYPDEFQDIVDSIVAEEREDEKDISWETVKKQLKKRGKL